VEQRRVNVYGLLTVMVLRDRICKIALFLVSMFLFTERTCITRAACPLYVVSGLIKTLKFLGILRHVDGR
jgi:hypothetical protein